MVNEAQGGGCVPWCGRWANKNVGGIWSQQAVREGHENAVSLSNRRNLFIVFCQQDSNVCFLWTTFPPMVCKCRCVFGAKALAVPVVRDRKRTSTSPQVLYLFLESVWWIRVPSLSYPKGKCKGVLSPTHTYTHKRLSVLVTYIIRH